MKIRDHFGTAKFIPATPSTKILNNETAIGVEVETEGCCKTMDFFRKRLKYWNIGVDGSLKSGSPYEFTFVQGLMGGQIVSALNELGPLLKEAKAEFPLNTSVHVHVDVGDMDREELRKFMYLSVVTESALIQYSGARWNNNFCIPWFAVDGSLLEQLGFFADMRTESLSSNTKYTSINFSTVPKLGTVEFRMMEGTGDMDRVLDWINIILQLKNYALNDPEKGGNFDPRERLDYLTDNRDVITFLNRIWPRHVVRKMLHERLHQDMVASSFAARLGLYPKLTEEFREFLRHRHDLSHFWGSKPQIKKNSYLSIIKELIDGGPAGEWTTTSTNQCSDIPESWTQEYHSDEEGEV